MDEIAMQMLGELVSGHVVICYTTSLLTIVQYWFVKSIYELACDFFSELSEKLKNKKIKEKR